MRFFDLQVNGYAGVDFNQDDLRAEDLHRACERLAADGVEGILATIITESLDKMESRLRRLAELRERELLVKRIIAGLHIEGPFINEADGYRGAHPLDAVRPASVDEMLRLLDAAGGLARVVTLAPERDPDLKVTRRLVKENVVVSAGHCNASLDELNAAIDAGLSMFTHLGNGCPMQMHRHDNIVQRVLSLSDRLRVTFIADGAHVPLFALKNYLEIVGLERAIVVTDAIAPAGLGPGEYTLGRWRLKIGDDLVARAPDGSHLVGAAMGMPRVVENLRSLGLSDDEIEQLSFTNPRRAIEGEGERGRLGEGEITKASLSDG
jgi:N-acetylglucosamine-6-phosphate deacetylase